MLGNSLMPSVQELQSYYDKLLNYNTTLKPSGSTICISSDLTYFHLNFCNAGNKALGLDFMKYTNSISFQSTWASMNIACKKKKKKETKNFKLMLSWSNFISLKGRWYVPSLYKTCKSFGFFLKTNSWLCKGAWVGVFSLFWFFFTLTSGKTGTL